ncbi:hypothetical protein [Geomonas sp. Red276]
MPANIQEVIESLGCPKPPQNLLQQPLDFDTGYLHRLWHTEQLPHPEDLYDYAHDLCYQELQPDLFLFLLPFCLQAWQQHLFDPLESRLAGFAELFSTAMAKHAGFRHILTLAQVEAVETFMRMAILEKIDQEKSLSFSGSLATPYTWISAIGTFGTVFPTVELLWKDWWSASTVGRACAVLQYVSALMYPDDRNPIFSPWTRDAGGGVPALWDTDSLSCDQAWLPENIAYLRGTLTPRFIHLSITTAAAMLRGNIQSSVPEQMMSDFERAKVLVELRVEELLQYLAVPLGEVRSWVTT